MSLDYINEAFRTLDLLTEDVFRADAEGINELSDFMSSDVDNEDKISIIDMDAESEDDLQDSYIGKVIVDCNVCHSHIFKDKNDIVIDEDGMVNSEDECPYCGEQGGFVIIGEIHEFKPADEEETEEGAEETPEEEVEETSELIEESLTEAVTLWDQLVKDYPELEGPVTEDFDTETGSKAWNNTMIKLYSEAAKNLGIENFDMKNIKNKAVISGVKNGEKVSHEVDYTDTLEVKNVEDAKDYLKYVFAELFNDLKEEFDDKLGRKIFTDKVIGYFKKAAEELGLSDFNIADLGDGKVKVTAKKDGKAIEETSTNDVVVNEIKDVEDAKEYIKYALAEIFYESFNESFKNVSLETEDQIMTMTSEDNGKVTVTTEPVDNATEGEVIAPVSDETESDIISANAEVVDDESTEEDITDELDVDFSEIDDESMSDLGESYLKKVYENVDSFKLTNCSTTPNQLIMEGIITFKSGTKKNTGFIFEAKDATRDGKVRFIGENAHLCRGRKAFTLVGSVNESKKLVCESFTYNYRAKNADGKSTRVYGKVNRNK